MASHPQVLVANAGTLHAFEAAAQLQRHGLLRRFATSIYVRESMLRWLPGGVRTRVAAATANRRRAELDEVTTTLAWPELACLAARQLGAGDADALIEWRNTRFCAWAGRTCLEGIRLVWAFDTSSYELFVAAKAKGLSCVLDMSIAHPELGRRLMTAYAHAHPELAPCMDASVDDAAIARRDAEIALADRIVVGSSFVRDSLLERGVEPSKIVVNQYGVHVEAFDGRARTDARGLAPRFLFVGWLSARKGIYDLLQAWRASGLAARGAELVVAGGSADALGCWHDQVPHGVTFAGRVEHAKLPALYASADVFVFPSLFEGSARVVLEAVASGLPVVTTPEACDDQWVVEGENGCRVTAGDTAALAARMQVLADDPGLRTRMSADSLARATRFTWTTYGDRCAAVCLELLEGAR
ncbi:MAG: glycosyltransferase family 4 protein [Vicinamibacterales bacterium]